MRKFHPVFYFWLIVLAVSVSGCDIGVKVLEFVVNITQEEEETALAYHQRRMREVDGPGWTDLHRAAAKGDVVEVQRLLKAGADIEARDEERGATALYEAARRGRVKVMEVLIQNGADVNVQEDNQWTPLAVASEYKQAGVVRLLIKHGADVDLRTIYGDTPLHRAAHQSWHGDAEIATILVEEGKAGIHIISNLGCYPLFCATLSNNDPVALYLLSKGADANFVHPKGAPTLFRAVAKENPVITLALLEHGAKPNVLNDTITPLMQAVMNQDGKITKLLLDHGADPNFGSENNRDCLMQAVVDRNYEITRMLLKHGADPNFVAEGFDTHLYYALKKHEDVELVRMLLEAGADPNKIPVSDSIPLFTALRIEHVEIVRLLLDHGADPMLKHSNGRTMQDFATYVGNQEVIDLFLQARLKRLEEKRKKKRGA